MFKVIYNCSNIAKICCFGVTLFLSVFVNFSTKQYFDYNSCINVF